MGMELNISQLGHMPDACRHKIRISQGKNLKFGGEAIRGKSSRVQRIWPAILSPDSSDSRFTVCGKIFASWPIRSLWRL